MNITGFIMSSDLIDTIHTSKYASESRGQPNHTDFFSAFSFLVGFIYSICEETGKKNAHLNLLMLT